MSRLIFALPVLVAATLASAQTAGQPKADQRRGELERLEKEAALSAETVARLEAEIRGLESDALQLRAELVETGRRMREAETGVLAAESRIQALATNETRLKSSLAERRGTLVEVIATLQRMGRRPPPALLVRPGDALEAIRTAMLLGAILPEMRAETAALAADLEELVRVRKEIAAERDLAIAQLVALAEDQRRIDLLVKRRQETQSERQVAIESERKRAADLAREVAGLKDLIARMESEVPSVEAATKEAQQAATVREKLATLEDPNRLVPAQPFEKMRGNLPLPVSGPVLRAFGAKDDLGEEQLGQSLATRPSATVLSPCDGWVVFAGPFRSYGKLLIVNAGDGYHVLLAGMDRIDVELGQFVLAGEPVGVMGSGETKVASNGDQVVGQPTLYVEFRKDNESIDPEPWWSKKDGKARG